MCKMWCPCESAALASSKQQRAINLSAHGTRRFSPDLSRLKRQGPPRLMKMTPDLSEYVVENGNEVKGLEDIVTKFSDIKLDGIEGLVF